MNKIAYQKLTIAAMGAALSLGVLRANPAQAVTFNLDWTGQTLGYKASGSFSYDETKNYVDGIVRKDNLESFNIAFFDPKGNLLQKFTDNQRTPDFNFNFDTKTGQILQDGLWNTDDGISIGGERNKGLNFWSIPNPGRLTFSDDQPSPHVHLDDWENEFPDLPRGLFEHLDVAFFTRTTAEVLNDPQAGNQIGQRLVASKVPEPSVLLGIGVVGVAGCLSNLGRFFPNQKSRSATE